MVVGTTLMKLQGNAYYSPQFNRGGLAANFAVNVEQIAGTTVSFDIDVEHKNADDTAFTTLVSFSNMVAAGLNSIDASGIKEQVRFKYVVNGSAATAAVHFLMMAPSWRPY